MINVIMSLTFKAKWSIGGQEYIYFYYYIFALDGVKPSLFTVNINDIHLSG